MFKERTMKISIRYIVRTALLSAFLLGTDAWASRTPQSQGGLTPEVYTVAPGDSLYTIARKSHTSISALREANNLESSSLIRPGQKLVIPSTSQKSAAAKAPEKSPKKSAVSSRAQSGEYVVKSGDTLLGIAIEHRLRLSTLCAANDLKPDATLRVGQKLKIPGAEQKPRTAKEPQKTATAKKKSPAAKKETQGSEYTVASGDTLFSIARKFHTPLKELMSLNGIEPTDVIRPGQKLKIPSRSYRSAKKAARANPAKGTKTQKSASAAPKSPKASKVQKPLYHTVRHGDTLWEIARKHKLSVAELRKLNHMDKKQVIRKGMKLLVRPGTESKVAKAAKPAAPAKVAKTYTVAKGDTLWLIAKRHKVSVDELRKLNKLKKGQYLRKGMKLVVGYEEAPATKTAVAKKSVKKPVRTAKKESPKKKSKVAKAQKSEKKKTRVARKSRSKKRSRRSADRRIQKALAALNGKSGGRSRGGDYNVIRVAKRYLGRRYVWGAEGPNSFDCSGFTQYVMRKSKGVRLPRVSRKQAYYGKYVSRSQLRPGDLIFFDTSRRRRGYVNHVGIYIGNGKFIHASSARHRVVITSLNSPFYRARFKWGRRVN